jgi:DNA polymerase-3 subunit delta
MFYILYGQDDFSLHQALEEIKHGLGDSEMLATSTTKLDAEHLTLNELKGNCNAAPFLSAYRLVIVNGLLRRFEPKQSKSRGGKHATTESQNELGEWQGVVSYIKEIPETTVVILVDGRISGYNSLLRKLSPLAKVSTFPLLRGRGLRNWIQQRVAEGGGEISPQAASLLAELIGGNLWAMSSEIDKLLLYSQGHSIDEDDVTKLVSHAQEANIFALVDAILEGRIKTAQNMLHRLYQEGASPVYVLAMITRQFRLIALTKDLDSSLSRPQIQNKLGLTSSYSLDKTLTQAKLYDFEHIKQAYSKLLETDLAIKTGKYSDQLALELLVADLCHASVSAGA